MPQRIRIVTPDASWKPRLPPGPRLGLRHGFWFLADPTAALADLQKKHGDLFTLPSPGAFGRGVFVADPQVVKEMFAAGPERLHTGEANAIMLEHVVGENSILSLDEQRHKRSRKLMLPPMHASRIVRYEPIIADIVRRETDGWQIGETFALVDALRGIALEILMRLMLGVREPERLKRFREAVVPVASPPGILTWSPPLRRHLGRWSPWTRFVRMRDVLYGLLDEEIALRRADPELEERDDILSLLIQARDDDGSPLSDLEVRDELMGVMGAGHHTTTAAIGWMFDQVLRHPEIEERLRRDLESGDERYLDATVDETLRWRAPIFAVPRRTMFDIEIDQWRLPKGTYLSVPLHAVHRRPDLYRDPDEFRPERFLDEAPGPPAWIPFGGGERRCIGANFAKLEMKVIARTILAGARLSLADRRPEQPRMSYVILFPRRGVKVVMTERLTVQPPALAEAG